MANQISETGRWAAILAAVLGCATFCVMAMVLSFYWFADKRSFEPATPPISSGAVGSGGFGGIWCGQSWTGDEVLLRVAATAAVAARSS